MSNLYFATELETLAGRLAKSLDASLRTHDLFQPTAIVVPHRPMGQWLRLWLARRHGIAINLQVQYLESSLWEMLREVDPRPQQPSPELLDGDSYRLLVLAILLENKEPGTPGFGVPHPGAWGLDYWQRFLQGAKDAGSRFFSRRLWHLADQLASLIRDYEYHRQDALIQPWLRGELGLGEAADLEAAERAIFAAITRLPDGKRAMLNEATSRNFKTLPQYAMEVMELPAHSTPPRRTLHLFGLTQMSMLHAVTLRWLGRFFDLQVYSLNALAGRLDARPTRSSIVQLASAFRQASSPKTWGPGQELLEDWARAGAESLHAMAELSAEPRFFTIETLSEKPVEDEGEGLPLFAGGRPATVLARLQDHLARGRGSATRLPQDRSLQIVGCPGRVREIETVYHSILANLHEQPDLKQSDIAVLATDMAEYRPILQAVFDRQERRVHYNLGDFSAAGVSIFGQALVGMLDLALDAFTRSGVFAVLLNPCFLARLGIERGQALVWLDWVRELGIYQSWDQGDKKERGYADTPLFAWQLGLRRLRLGRVMEVSRDDAFEPAPRFGSVIPFSDVHSGNPEELNTFCLAVEGLLPRLARLRKFEGSAGQWVSQLEALIRDFLSIPDDRPEETQVQDRLLAALRNWLLADHLGGEQRLPLALVREMTASALEGIEGVRGQYLAGGVTIASLHPLKPMPFRIVYIVGLGEDIFPGSNVLSGLDLRGRKSFPGDIRPAEFNRYLFLETLLAGREKIYLLYSSFDIQKDQILHPAVPLQQLKRYLGEKILERPFEEAQVPLLAHDARYLRNDNAMSTTDVLAQCDETDRLLALTSSERTGLRLSSDQEAELEQRLRRRRVDFALPEASASTGSLSSTVSLHDLTEFLKFPGTSSRRHLQLGDGKPDDLTDDEPFVSDNLTASGLMRHMLNHLVLRAVQSGTDQALCDFRQNFERVYDEWTCRGRLPEEAFGQVDRVALWTNLEERVFDAHLDDFLKQRQKAEFCGPVLLGESVVPLGARLRFPALTLPLARPLPRRSDEVRLVGSMPLVWRTDNEIDILTWRIPKIRYARDLYPLLLEPVLFWMALKAGTLVPVVGPGTARHWLGNRSCTIHLAHAKGIEPFLYAFNEIDPEIARDYLSLLATDYLDPACMDNLPLSIILRQWELRKAITSSDNDQGELPENFSTMLGEFLDEEPEEGNRYYSSLAEILGAQVPADAYAKVRRRFRPFNLFDTLNSRQERTE